MTMWKDVEEFLEEFLRGYSNLEEAINAENHSSCSAQDLLTNIAKKVTKHIDTAEQFDDLTILVLKAKDGK